MQMKQGDHMKKKLFVFLVMMTVMLCMPFLFSLDTEAVMTEDKIFEMKTKAVSLNKGDVVDVTFHVRNMETGGFYGYLNYDTTVLSALTPSHLIPADFSSQVKAVSGSALDVQVDYGTWLAHRCRWHASYHALYRDEVRTFHNY